MKKLLSSALLASLSILSVNVLADRPCKTIVEACISAGVIQKSTPRNDMIAHCVKPVVAGRSLSGVSVDPSVIKACKAKMAAR